MIRLVTAALAQTEVHPGIRYAEELVDGPIRRFIADIDTCAPGVRFRATSPLDGTSPRPTSDLARSIGAVLAINGDFFDHDFGLNLGDGVDWAPFLDGLSDGRDRETSGNLAIGADRIELVPDHVVLAGPEPWMEEVVGGRWTFIEAGVPSYGIADGGFVCSPGLRLPRTVVGRSGDGRHLFLMVVDGRGFGGSIGMTCDEVIDRMIALGATDAMGLDGGGSSTMYLDTLGVVNHPTDGSERPVLNHLAVFADGAGPAPHCGELGAAPVAADPVGPIVTVGAPGWFSPVSPTRLFDTRAEVSGLVGVSLDGDGRVSGDSQFAFDPGLPSDTVGVWVALTATGSSTPGFVTVWPGGTALPATSSLNHDAGEVVGSAAIVGLDPDLALYTSASSHLVLDLAGTFGASGAGLVPRVPERILDTRTTGARLVAFAPTVIAAPLPAPTVAASLNLAVVDPVGSGFLTVFPCDEGVPEASVLNFDGGEIVAGAASVRSTAGICAVASADLDLVVDLDGTWDDGAGLAIQAIAPLRVLDTRLGTGGWKGRVKPGQVIPLPLSSIAGWPSDGHAAALRVTVTEPSAPGFLTVYPCADGLPATSSLNYAPGATVGNLAVTALSDAGEVCVYASGATHLVVDLTAVGVGIDALPDLPVIDGSDAIAAPEGCRTGPPGSGLGWLGVVWLVRRRAPRLSGSP